MLPPSFKLPIALQESKRLVPSSVRDDLELDKTQNGDGPPTFERIVGSHSTEFGKLTMPLWTQYYTDDVAFLRDTQRLFTSGLPKLESRYEAMAEVWSDIQQETNFHERYQFIEWEWLESLNHNPSFLQALSMYNMGSPLLSLALPVLLMVTPLFILRSQGRSVSFTDYFSALKRVLRNHQIGQLFTVGSASWDKRTYVVISFCFYIFQVYQNFMACIRFHRNMRKIHDDIVTVRGFVEDAVTLMDAHEEVAADYTTYREFTSATAHHRRALVELLYSLKGVSRWKLSASRLGGVGRAMCCYYRICRRDDIQEALRYAVQFVGYCDNVSSLKASIAAKRLTPCSFNDGSTQFRGAFFPGKSHRPPVRNTYTLQKQLMITGPNASGKTTLLKTTLLNILLCQQIGMGFFKAARIAPYGSIHCYLNIPDTSGRDSLFQAEARRCKDILDAVEKSPPGSRHFCVFDELYSGTNPSEAVASAVAFLRYLNRYPGVSYIVTTHFTDLCRRLESDKKVRNCCMSTKERDDGLRYTYRLVDGVSSVRGGARVLKALHYPVEILEDTKNMIAGMDE